MGSRLLWALATATILLQICSVCWCKVTVSVKFITYRNTHGKDHEGKQCDPPAGGCDHYFEICIDKNRRNSPNTANWLTDCDYGLKTTGWYHDQKIITFDHDIRTVANPINVDIADSEEGVTLRVRVMDHDDGSWPRGGPDVVDHLEFKYIIAEDKGLFKRSGSAEKYRKLILGKRSTTVPTSLAIDFSAYCADHFYKYQGQCTKYCKQSSSPHFGYYSCTEDGDKRCFKGWKDESTNCTTQDQTNVLLPAASAQGSATNDNKGLIIGVVLGIFFLILIAVIIIALLVRERRKRKLKEQGTSAVVSTTTMGLQTNPSTTDTGTGGSYANPAFLSSSDTSAQTDNNRNQRAAHGTQTANGHGVKVMEAALLSPPPYKVADIPRGGSERFNNLTYGEQQVGAVGRGYGNGNVENTYDEVGLNKKY